MCGPIGASVQCQDGDNQIVTQNCCSVSNSIASIKGEDNGEFAAPGLSCANNGNPQGMCTGDPTDWNFYYGQECPGQWLNNSVENVPSQLVQACNPGSLCQYTCKEGYNYVPATATDPATCVAGNTCLNPPDNASLCDFENGDKGLINPIQSIVVDDCEEANAIDKCVYTCDFGYLRKGNTCVLNPANPPTQYGCYPMVVTATVADPLADDQPMPKVKVELTNTSVTPNDTVASTTDSDGNVVFQNLAMLTFGDTYTLTALTPDKVKYEDSDPVTVATNLTTPTYSATLELNPVAASITNVTVSKNFIANSGSAVMAVIKWKTKNFIPGQTVNIDLTDTNDNTIKPIASGIPYANDYSWLPDPSIPTGHYEVVVSSATAANPTFSHVFSITTSGMPNFALTTSLVPPASGATCVTKTPFTITLSGVDPTTGKPASFPKGDKYEATIYLDYQTLPVITGTVLPRTIKATLTTNASGAIINGITLPPGAHNMSANIVVKDAAGNIIGTYYSNNIQPFMTVGTCTQPIPTFTLTGTLFTPQPICVEKNPITAIISAAKTIPGSYSYNAELFVDGKNQKTLFLPLPITFNGFITSLSNPVATLNFKWCHPEPCPYSRLALCIRAG